MSRRAVLCAGAALLLAACGGASAPGGAATSAGRAGGGNSTLPDGGPPTRLSLSEAMRLGTDLGPTTEQVHVSLTLAIRDAAALDALITRGVVVGADEYARRFGPDPAAVASLRSRLSAAGIDATWNPGETTLHVSAPAGRIAALLGTSIHDYRAPDGTLFHAPQQPASIPAALRGTVAAVVGLDSYQRASVKAVPVNGVGAADVISFYDIKPLIDAGNDGAGMTVFLPEIDTFQQSDLDLFAQKHNLPPFVIDNRADPAFGSADASSHGEADLDLEIIHSIAPKASLVVYPSAAAADGIVTAEGAMLDAATKDGAHSVISSSIGICEDPNATADLSKLYTTSTQRAAAAGLSFFIASGDRGAFGCLEKGDPSTVTGDTECSQAFVTCVGGTAVFLAKEGGYFKEAGWGEPIEQWGSGGGVSHFVPQPDWQKGPGVQNSDSTGRRQTPDVSALADGQTGWDVIVDGQDQKIGGTSAAAPLWSAITVLADQQLVKDGGKPVGFVNPAIYWIGSNLDKVPPGLHDILHGSNLLYQCTPGWDYVTGFGTPDVANLVQDFAFYQKNVSSTTTGGG